MKIKALLVALVLCGLALSSYSYHNRTEVNPNDKDVFIKGKLIFKDKNLPKINFWIEGDNGYYSLILFQDNYKVDDHLIRNEKLVKNIFVRDIYSLSNDTIFNNKYFIINFKNTEIFNIRGIKLFMLGYKIIKDIELETNGKVSGHLIL